MLNRQITAIGPNVADQVSNIMELERLDREVHRLPENLRSVIIERYYLGYSLQEISERMEISLSAVDGRLRRARTLLRGRLLVGGLSATAFLGNAAATVKAAYVSGELISATCDCLHNTSRSSTTSDSTSFQQLVEGELAMFSKVKWATWSLACSVILVASAGSFMAFASQSATTVRDASIILSSESNQLERYSVPATRVTQFKVLDSSASASPVANAFAGRDRSPGDSDVFATGSSTDDSLVQTNMGLTLDELEEVSSSEFELLKAKYELKQERSIETTMMTTMLIPNYSQIPIRAVMKELSEATGIPILFDDKAIESGGIFTPDDPISLEVNTPLPVSQVLQYVLQQFEFDYKIENGIVIITSNGEVSVSHLYSTKGFENPQQLIEGLKKLVPGVYEPTLIGDSLALTAPRNHHRKILRVLALLKEQAESQ